MSGGTDPPDGAGIGASARPGAGLIGWFAVLAVQTVTAILAFRHDREPLRPPWALPLQQVLRRSGEVAAAARGA